MVDRASGNLRVRKRASACLYTFDISDLALRGEDTEPCDEPRSRDVDSASSVGSTSAVDDPLILLFDVMCHWRKGRCLWRMNDLGNQESRNGGSLDVVSMFMRQEY